MKVYESRAAFLKAWPSEEVSQSTLKKGVLYLNQLEKSSLLCPLLWEVTTDVSLLNVLVNLTAANTCERRFPTVT